MSHSCCWVHVVVHEIPVLKQVFRVCVCCWESQIKITDFGLSKILHSEEEASHMELTSQGAGTYWCVCMCMRVLLLLCDPCLCARCEYCLLACCTCICLRILFVCVIHCVLRIRISLCVHESIIFFRTSVCTKPHLLCCTNQHF